MYVRVPRTKKRQLQLPCQVRTDNADVVKAGYMYHIGLEFEDLPKNAVRVTLKKMVG